MRQVLLFIAMSFGSSVCFAQSDSTKTTEPPVQKQVAIPGVDTPISGGGMTAQMPTTPVPPRTDNKKRKTQPPTDPRAFGVSVPLGKTRKDSL